MSSWLIAIEPNDVVVPAPVLPAWPRVIEPTLMVGRTAVEASVSFGKANWTTSRRVDAAVWSSSVAPTELAAAVAMPWACRIWPSAPLWTVPSA